MNTTTRTNAHDPSLFWFAVLALVVCIAVVAAAIGGKAFV